jgi:hypothetical protein
MIFGLSVPICGVTSGLAEFEAALFSGPKI